MTTRDSRPHAAHQSFLPTRKWPWSLRRRTTLHMHAICTWLCTWPVSDHVHVRMSHVCMPSPNWVLARTGNSKIASRTMIETEARSQNTVRGNYFDAKTTEQGTSPRTMHKSLSTRDLPGIDISTNPGGWLGRVVHVACPHFERHWRSRICVFKLRPKGQFKVACGVLCRGETPT